MLCVESCDHSDLLIRQKVVHGFRDRKTNEENRPKLFYQLGYGMVPYHFCSPFASGQRMNCRHWIRWQGSHVNFMFHTANVFYFR